MVSLETRDYSEAVQRAREIMDSPELQPAQSFAAEVERFLKHKYETNRYSKMSAESKRSCLNLFADSVKNIPPANVTGYHCKAFYSAAKARVAASTAESYMFTLRSTALLICSCHQRPPSDCARKWTPTIQSRLRLPTGNASIASPTAIRCADFCRGWLVAGDTGSGKTRSGITPLLFQVFQNEPTWGGLCIDDKGVYWETLSEMARHFGREEDLILLQVRPESAGLKKRVIKKSWGYHSGRMSRNYSEQEEHKMKPHLLRNLPKHTAVIVHCEGGHRRKLLPPIDANGQVCAWFE